MHSRQSGGFLVRCLAPAALFATGALHPTPAAAITFGSDGLFGLKGQSVWSAGPGFTLDTGPKFFGADWNVGKTVGGVSDVCFLGACASFGAEIGADTHGRVGLDYGLKVNSGTFDLQYPGRALFTLPNAVPGTQIGALSIGSSFAALPSVQVRTGPLALPETRSPTLQVTGPTAQAYVDLAAQLHAFAGARVCVGVCYGPSIGPFDINESRELAALNRNGDGQIRVLGTSVSANQTVSALGGLLNASLSIPNLDSSSVSTPGGFNGTNLTSAQRSNVAAVNVNIAQIAADSAGLPVPLSGNLGPIGYNLLQANAGLAIDVQQTLRYTPAATGSYIFSSKVVPRVNGVDGAPTNRIDFRFGDEVTFSPGQVSTLGIQPFITLGGSVRNQTDLVLSGSTDIRALGANVAGVTIGPLVDEHLTGSSLGRINVLDTTFDENLGTVMAAPITIDFAACANAIGGSGEFLLLGLCASSGLSRGLTDTNPDGTRQDEIIAFNCGPQTLSGPGVCSEFQSSFTSPYLPRPGGDLFLDDRDTLVFNGVVPGPGSTTRGQFATLESLGYTGLVSAFVIPDGDPLSSFPVPEPGSWPMLFLGLVGLTAYLSRQDRNRT